MLKTERKSSPFTSGRAAISSEGSYLHSGLSPPFHTRAGKVPPLPREQKKQCFAVDVKHHFAEKTLFLVPRGGPNACSCAG